jgi:hypothetical protein
VLSIDGVRLHALLPAYLRRTSIGLRIVFLGAVLYCLGAGTMFVANRIPSVGPFGLEPERLTLMVIGVAVMAAVVLGMLGILAGWLMATSRPPFVTRKLRSRGITQRGIIAILLALVCFVVVALAGTGGMATPFAIGAGLAGVVLVAGFVLFYFGSLMYMRGLAGWIPDRLIGRLVTAQLIIVLSAIVISISAVIFKEIVSPDFIIALMMLIVMVLYVSLWILYMWTTHRLSSQFRRALRKGAELEAEADRLATGATVAGQARGQTPGAPPTVPAGD